MTSLLVTGGAGFIGSAFVRRALQARLRVVIYDALTYAGHLPNIEECLKPGLCEFIKGDICDHELLLKSLKHHSVDAIVNFAAESHVDNSILGPKPFIETNILGTFTLLEAARTYYDTLSPEKKKAFRLLHISTDEVFGELGEQELFSEESPYRPNSPYSASKAASDHLVRAWHRTYGLPVLITNCSNNYGPRQFPEKLIPRLLTCALSEKPLPVYGQGANIRDWIHVEDHADGIWQALNQGEIGQSYCFGGASERQNIEVVKQLCKQLDELRPRENGRSYAELITFVEDRAGHDFRYAIDDRKAVGELGFIRRFPNFEEGLRETIQWYLNNENWLRSVLEKNK